MRVRMVRARDRGAGPTWWQVILTGAALIVVVGMIAAGSFSLSAGGNQAAAKVIPAQPGSLPWNRHDRLTMLLMGVDGSPGSHSPTAGMMIASYDPASRSVRLLAIPDSLWVTIPGYGESTISQAYSDGGARLALVVAESVTGVVIPYYAAIGADATRQIVQSSGGIRIGGRSMGGGAILRYYQSASDAMARMTREEALFLALKQQVLQPQDAFQLPALINGVGDSIDTNFPYDQFTGLGRMLMRVPRSHVQTAALDYVSGAVSNYSANGEHVLLPDWQTIRTVARGSIGRPGRLHGKVEVLNGSGAPGAAAALAHLLGEFGLPVAGYGSADSFSYAHTEVVINTRSTQRQSALARATAAALQAPVVTQSVRKSKVPVVVIIGRDFQDPTQQ